MSNISERTVCPTSLHAFNRGFKKPTVPTTNQHGTKAPSKLIEAGLDTGLDSFFIVKTMVFETSHMPSRLHRGSSRPASMRVLTAFHCKNNAKTSILIQSRPSETWDFIILN